jgi:hypothetical protein
MGTDTLPHSSKPQQQGLAAMEWLASHHFGELRLT